MKGQNEQQDRTEKIIVMFLEVAVPMWYESYVRHYSYGYARERAEYCSKQVASKGDDLQFGGKYCAETFNALAEGTAILAAMAKGGIPPEGDRFFGSLKFDFPMPKQWGGNDQL